MKLSHEHELFRDNVRAFVAREIAPHVQPGTRPDRSRASCTRAPRRSACSAWATPRSYGGTPADGWYRLVATEEIARAGSGGLMASLFSHNIGLPPILAHGQRGAAGSALCRPCCAARRSPRWPSPSPAAAPTWRGCARTARRDGGD